MAIIGWPSHKSCSARSCRRVRNANVRPIACRSRAPSCAPSSLRYGLPILPLLLSEPHTVLARIVQLPPCQHEYKSLIWPHIAISAVVPFGSTYAPVFLQSTIHASDLGGLCTVWEHFIGVCRAGRHLGCWTLLDGLVRERHHNRLSGLWA